MGFGGGIGKGTPIYYYLCILYLIAFYKINKTRGNGEITFIYYTFKYMYILKFRL